MRIAKYVSLFLISAMLLSTVLGVAFGATVKYDDASAAYKNGIYYDKLMNVELTGDLRADIVNIAISQIGYCEGDNVSHLGGEHEGKKDYTEYGRWYTKNVLSWLTYSSWCAVFVSWCARVANVPDNVITNAINAKPGTNEVRHFRNLAAVYERKSPDYKLDYVPLPGDLIFFDWDKKFNTWDHVGIVIDVVDDIVFTVEGNSGNGVNLRTYRLNEMVIRAYGVPKYASDSNYGNIYGPGHKHEWTVVKHSTCDQKGTKKCKTCGQTGVMFELGHQYWIWGDVHRDEDKPKYMHVDKQPTCTDPGQKSFHCIRCGHKDKIEPIAATGHNYVEASRTESTCNKTGKITYVCKNDSKHTKTEDLPIGTHVATDWITVKPATYYEEGLEQKQCKYCSIKMDERITPILVDTTAPTGTVTVGGHTTDGFNSNPTVDVTVNKAPEVKIEAKDSGIGIDKVYYSVTSTPFNMDQVKAITNWQPGSSYTPNADGTYYVYAKLVDKAGNIAYLSSVGITLDTVLPIVSGLENGKTYCADVHFTVNEAVKVVVNSAAIGINADGEYVLFGTAGYTVEIMDMAGNSLSYKVQVNSKHTAGTPVVTVDPTCTKMGTKVTKCTVCSHTIKKESIKALGHDNGEWSTTKQATCTESGTRIRCCTICDAILETVTEPAQGHIKSGWTLVESATCTKNGKEEIYCMTCSQTVEERVIFATGHIVGGWETQIAQTCTTDGLMAKHCVVCNEMLESEVLPKTGHVHSEWTTESSPTCTEDGKRIRKCKACGEVLEEIITEKLGHNYVNSKCEVCGSTSPVLIVTFSASAVAIILLIVTYDITNRRKINKNRPKSKQY